MPISYPPDIALREFFGSTTRHTRRVEIYEQDGITPWIPGDVLGDVTRINRCTNPSSEVNSTNWSSYFSPTRTTSTDWASSGTLSQKIVKTASTNQGLIYMEPAVVAGIVPGDTVTIGIDIMAPANLTVSVAPRGQYAGTPSTQEGANFGTEAVKTVALVAGVLQRVVIQFTVPALVGAQTALTHLGVQITNNGAAIGTIWYADAVTIEDGFTNGTRFDGSTLDTKKYVYDWLGLANQSASTVRPVLQSWTQEDVQHRLVGGSVTVDYSRAERRALDLTLSNDDGAIRSAPGEFWYDKVIKVFRGVKINERLRVPKILIFNDMTDSTTLATSFRKMLVEIGYGDVRINQTAIDYQIDGKPFDIIISLQGVLNDPGESQDFLNAAIEDGKSVMAFELSAEQLVWKMYPTTTNAATGNNTLVKPTFATAPHPVNTGWTNYAASPTTSFTFLSPGPNAAGAISPYWKQTATDNAGTRVAQAAIQSRGANPNGRGVLYFQSITKTMIETGVEFRKSIVAAMGWLNTVTAMATWECQVGEFQIDRISEDNFPHLVKITGRDYTKKCLLSKYKQATQFATGQTLEALITSISGAAGVTKRALPVTGITVGRTFFFDRGVTRWDAMKDICGAYDYDIFFDATGYLIIKPYSDPATTAPSVVLETGKLGTLATYSKSTTDTRIYNSIIVTGESSDTSTPNVYAIAENHDPLSPTSIEEIGERVYQYTSSFITTTLQAQAVADSFLAIHALEEFDLNFTALMMPWLEVGDIMSWVDPNPAPGDPTEFLISTISIPFELGPMSSTGKRVTNVG